MSLVLKQKVSRITLCKRYIVHVLGRLIYELYQKYYNNEIFDYGFHGNRLDMSKLSTADDYVDGDNSSIAFYKKEIRSKKIESLSQYYPYGHLEKLYGENLGLRICNIGCFYAGCDEHFLKRNPNSLVVGLDFGRVDIVNNDIVSENLNIIPGYPLHTLEKMLKTQGANQFDCAIFVRTAVKINIEQLNVYMEVLSKLSKEVIFLENAKLLACYRKKVDVYNINLENSLKLYRGMYLHNYPLLLEKYGYQVVDSKVISAGEFDQSLTPDHDFVFVHGRRP